MQLFFGFALKISIIIFSFQIIHNFYDGTLKFTFSWLLAYCIMLINMLLLSFFSLLTGHNLIIGLFVSISVLILILKNIKKEAIVSHPVEKCRFSFSLSNMLTPLAIIALTITFVLLLYRNLLYYDTTDDALTQGMPKLAFIQQHASLFVNYETWTINVFSNEWFGELNALFYLLISKEDSLILLGNTEIYLFTIVAIYESIIGLKFKSKNAWLLVAYFSTLPVILGLAMTIKTDLISAVMVLILIMTIKSYFDTQNSFLLFASIAMIGATASSKITLIPIAGLYTISIVLFYLKQNKKPIIPVILGVLFALLFCNRYLINLIQYHNPIQRALNEKIMISFHNLIENICGILQKFTDTKFLLDTIQPGSNSNWVLLKSMGYGSEILLIILIISSFYYIFRKRNLKPSAPYLILPYIGALLYTLLGTEWKNWAFRYFSRIYFALQLLF